VIIFEQYYYISVFHFLIVFMALKGSVG